MSKNLQPDDNHLPYHLSFDLEDLTDLAEVRRILEVGMIEDAMRAMTNQQLSRLRQIVERMRTLAEYGESFVEEDREFHQCLFENPGNKVLLKLLNTFWLIYYQAAQHIDIQDKNPMRTYREHAAIVKAVRAKNTIQARIALDQHYNSLKNRMNRVKQGSQRE